VASHWPCAPAPSALHRSLQWHPDKHLNAGQAARCLAEDKFKAARSAYEALIADHRGG
jgi:DnaJ-class molecular chaperone